MAVADAIETVDLAVTPLRELNRRLHAADPAPRWRIAHPNGAHAVAVGIDAEIEVDVDGHVGYYCAGMNKRATVRVHGNAGVGLAENIMSGTRRRRRLRRPVVRGDRPRRAGGRARRRVGALRDLDEGRRHRRRRLGRAHERVHGAEGRARRLRRRRRGARRLDLRGAPLRARQRRLARRGLRREGAARGARRRAARAARARRRRRATPADVPPLRLGAAALHLRRRRRGDRRRLAPGAARVGDVRPQRDRGDPARGARGHLRHPRLGRQAARAALRRPAVPRRERLALPARGLPRALRHRRRARRPPRVRAAAARRSRSRSRG